MSFVIASQFEDGFNEALRGHTLRPTVIAAPEQSPWEAANDADILLVRPSPAWRENRQLARPASWPGRVRWVCSGSVGVDFYPRWLLEAPLVSCGRGVASEEIADYVISAIYHHAKDLESGRGRSLSLGIVTGDPEILCGVHDGENARAIAALRNLEPVHQRK